MLCLQLWWKLSILYDIYTYTVTCGYNGQQDHQSAKEIIQIYVDIHKNSQAVKKCGPCKKTAWKKWWNQRWQPRSGCDGRIRAKFLITTIQCCLLQAPELLLLKFFHFLPYASQPLLGCHLGFRHFIHAFFFKWDLHLLLQLVVFE